MGEWKIIQVRRSASLKVHEHKKMTKYGSLIKTKKGKKKGKEKGERESIEGGKEEVRKESGKNRKNRGEAQKGFRCYFVCIDDFSFSLF
jgi:hypothetical protein